MRSFLHKKLLQGAAITFLIFLVLLGIVGPLFTSNAPWKASINEKTQYPAIRYFLADLKLAELPVDWKTMDWNTWEGKKTNNLIPYDASYIDLAAIGGSKPARDDQHALGTDLLGKDVLAGIIEGTRTSLGVSLIAILLALFLAIILAVNTSYYGNDLVKISALQLALLLFFTVLGAYYFFIGLIGLINSLFWSCILFAVFIFLLLWLSKSISLGKGTRSITIPLDSIGMKFYEIFQSIPKLILLLLLIGLSPKTGVLNLALIIGCLVWPIFYRYLRFDIIQTKETEEFQNLQNLGFPDWRILLVHILPKALRSVITPILFAFGSIILLESTLSFLGIGLAEDLVSWGKILSQARLRIDAWWLAVFPGMMIFLTLYSLNIVARKLDHNKLQSH